jgi:type III pantothenate kinase
VKLLIDLGNTRLKAALWDGRQLAPAGIAVHGGDVGKVDFGALWTNLADVDAVVVASVAVAAIGARLDDAIAARFGRRARFLTSPAVAGGVRNGYAEPARLGIDRFLALVAAHADVPGACVHAGCGTALTLDALGADGAHRGGLIAPSPALMLDALTGATARLAPPRDARIVEMADNTADAMESGAWLAAAALVERFVERAAATFGTRPALVLSGGGAARLSALLAPAHRTEPDLVLRGLAIMADAAA